MNDELFDFIDEKIPSVDDNVRYWMVRTEGGNLFQSFCHEGVIAIAYPEVSITDVKNTRGAEDRLHRLVEEKYPETKRPGIKVTQLHRFFYEMKKGDFVVIPSISSASLSIGVITDDEVSRGRVYRYVRGERETASDYKKIRKVKWLKRVRRNFINPKFYKIWFSHQTIVDASDYSDVINSMLYDFYKSNEAYNIVFDVGQQHINANFFDSYSKLISVANSIALAHGYQESINDVEINVNLNSPGKMVLFGKAGVTLLVTGLLIIGINGGEFEVAYSNAKISASTRGFIDTYNEYLEDEADRDLMNIMREKLEELDIEDPKEIKSLLEEIQ